MPTTLFFSLEGVEKKLWTRPKNHIYILKHKGSLSLIECHTEVVKRKKKKTKGGKKILLLLVSVFC